MHKNNSRNRYKFKSSNPLQRSCWHSFKNKVQLEIEKYENKTYSVIYIF